MGGGLGMGNTCKPMAVSFQCMTKSTTIKKIIIITIIKIFFGKKKDVVLIILWKLSGNKKINHCLRKEYNKNIIYQG